MLTLVAIITGVVLGSGIGALLLIEMFGWWTDPASEDAGDAARDVFVRLRARAVSHGLTLT